MYVLDRKVRYIRSSLDNRAACSSAKLENGPAMLQGKLSDRPTTLLGNRPNEIGDPVAAKPWLTYPGEAAHTHTSAVNVVCV